MVIVNKLSINKTKILKTFHPWRACNLIISILSILFAFLVPSVVYPNRHQMDIWPLNYVPFFPEVICSFWFTCSIIGALACFTYCIPGLSWIKISKEGVFYRDIYTLFNIKYIPSNVIDELYITKRSRRESPCIGIKYYRNIKNNLGRYDYPLSLRTYQYKDIVRMANLINSIHGQSFEAIKSNKFNWQRYKKALKNKYKGMALFAIIFEIMIDFLF